jgi:hypothetical protein
MLKVNRKKFDAYRAVRIFTRTNNLATVAGFATALPMAARHI